MFFFLLKFVFKIQLKLDFSKEIKVEIKDCFYLA